MPAGQSVIHLAGFVGQVVCSLGMYYGTVNLDNERATYWRQVFRLYPFVNGRLRRNR